MLDPDKSLELAEEVARAAENLGIKTALIGASALVVHGYTRGTDDIDLAAAVPPDLLRQLFSAMRAAGLRAVLRQSASPSTAPTAATRGDRFG